MFKKRKSLCEQNDAVRVRFLFFVIIALTYFSFCIAYNHYIKYEVINMYTDVYADVLFLINFSMDTIGLFVTARLCAVRVKVIRIVVAAIFGSLYAVVSLFLDLAAFIELAVVILVCVIMVCIAYPQRSLREVLKQSTVMFVSSSLLGGVMSAFYSVTDDLLGEVEWSSRSIDPLLFCVIACISMAAGLFLTRLHGSGNMPPRVKVKIKLFDNEISVDGIVDTGNLLTDPLSGKRVILIGSKYLGGIISDELMKGAVECDLSIAYRLSERERSRFRLIPARGIDRGTYLFGVIVDDLNLSYSKGRRFVCIKRDALLAIAPQLNEDTVCVVPSAIL